MTTIVTRADKGSPLTNTEVDTNFTNLNTAKIETLTSTDTSVTITGTGSSRDLSVPINPNVASGPASSTDNAVTRFDGTTGKLLQNSVVTVGDTGIVAGASISGASNTLSNIANASLTNSAITINGTSTALGGSISVGTVTSVTGTSPVASSGGATPAISLAASYGDTQNPYASKTANFVLAAPTGAAGVPTFRAVVAADIPTLNQNTTGSAATFTSTTQNSQFNSLGVGTAGSAVAGEIRATNNITAYYSSDRQFKENIEVIPNALDSVDAIGGKLFDWTDAYLEAHGGEDAYFIHKADFGVIAQDVQAVFPRAVRSRPDGSLAVDYEKLVALAFAAIVELKAEVDELKKG